jgi:hypothetical protein
MKKMLIKKLDIEKNGYDIWIQHKKWHSVKFFSKYLKKLLIINDN